MGVIKISKLSYIFVVSIVLLGYLIQDSNTTDVVLAQENQNTPHPYTGLDQTMDITDDKGEKIGEAKVEPMDHNEITYCIEKKYHDGNDNLSDKRYKEFKEAIKCALKQWTDLKICLKGKEIKFKEVKCDEKPDLVFRPIHDPKKIDPEASNDTAGVANMGTIWKEVARNKFRAWVSHSEIYVDTDKLNNGSGPLSKEELCNLIRHEIGHAVFGFADLYEATAPADLKDSSFIHDKATEKKGFSKWDKEELKTRFKCPKKEKESACLPVSPDPSSPSSFVGIPPVITDTESPYISGIHTVITTENVVISAQTLPAISEECYLWTVVKTPEGKMYEVDVDFPAESFFDVFVDVVTTEGKVGKALASFDGENVGIEIPSDILGNPEQVEIRYGVYDCEKETDVFKTPWVTVTNEFARYQTLMESIQDAVDTVVKRLDEAEESGVIDTEIIQMELKGTDPMLGEIKVTYPTMPTSQGCIETVEKLKEFSTTLLDAEKNFENEYYGKALEDFTKAQEILDDLGYLEISEALEKKKEDCEKYIHLLNNEADEYFNTGVKQYENKEYEKAREGFEKAKQNYEKAGNEEKAKECEKYLHLIEEATKKAGVELLAVLVGFAIGTFILKKLRV